MLLKRVIRFHHEHGFKALLVKIRQHVRQKAKIWYEKYFSIVPKAHEIIYQRFPCRKPIPYIKTNSKNNRLNLVVDDLENHLSPLILALLFASRHQASLRIISRTSECTPRALFNFLEHHKLPKPIKIEFFSDFKRERRLEVSEREIFLATSPCTSEAIKALHTKKHFLFSNLQVSPSFSFKPRELQPKDKYKLLLHPQDLFFRGLELIEEAALRGILTPREWELYFTGPITPSLKFSNGLKPKYLPKVSFSHLQEFDLFLSFNDPYKPYEVAALGGVALTNQTIKNDPNIIVAEMPVMLQAFEKAVTLAKNPAPFPHQAWEYCFNPTIAEMEEHVLQT